MSQSQTTDLNATPLNDGSGLRGGTEGGKLTPPVANEFPSNLDSGSPAGGSTNPAPAGTPRRAQADVSDPTDTLSRAAGDASRHLSTAEAMREARSAADAPTRSGFNENDPANDGQREDISDGTRASTSGRKVGEPGEAARADG